MYLLLTDLSKEDIARLRKTDKKYLCCYQTLRPFQLDDKNYFHYGQFDDPYNKDGKVRVLASRVEKYSEKYGLEFVSDKSYFITQVNIKGRSDVPTIFERRVIQGQQ